MGLFSILRDTASAVNQDRLEKEKKLTEQMANMDIEELGRFFSKKFKSSSSINARAYLLKTTFTRLKEYSTSERRRFLNDYEDDDFFDINFINVVKKSLGEK